MLLNILRITATAILTVSSALAHDRHANAAMHQEVRVQISQKDIEVTFQVETNEEGTFVEAIAMDADGDGKLSTTEQSTYFAQLDARLREGLQIALDRKDVMLTPAGSVELAPPAKKTFHFKGKMDPGMSYPARLEVHNDNFLDWPGRAKLDVEAGKGVALTFSPLSGSDVVGTIVDPRHEAASPTPPTYEAMDWRQWSWTHRLRDPFSIMLGSAFLLAVAAVLLMLPRYSPTIRITGAVLVVVSLNLAVFALRTSVANPIPAQVWQDEFNDFHAKLSRAVTEYHRDGADSSLSHLGTSDAIRALIAATRVVKPRDETSGTFELRRVRPVNTTLLDTPKSILHPQLRVHHEWRAIGVMRHQGHPHERIRNFACDYTLALTDHGFQLLDCTNWHQLPDEPISE